MINMTFKEFKEAGGVIQYDMMAINSYEIDYSGGDTLKDLKNGLYDHKRIETDEDGGCLRIDVCIYDDVIVFEYGVMDDVAAFIEAGCAMDKAGDFGAYRLNSGMEARP